MSASVPPFPFVVGAGRSGTTLLRAMLDSHPDLAVPGESWFIVEYAPRFRHRWWRRFDGDAFSTALFEHSYFMRWGLDASDVRAALAAAPPADYASAVRAVYVGYAARQGKARYCDKTPGYVLHIDVLSDLFAESCFVHLIRDGRDVALSLREIDEWGPSKVAGAAKYWVEHVNAGRVSGQALGPSRYLEVRYEDLVDDPESALRSVCGFIDLPFDDCMLSYYERADQVMASIALPQHHERIRKPPTRDLRSWRTEMLAADVAAFEAIAGPLLSELGYELASQR
jgi:hypothetical protein